MVVRWSALLGERLAAKSALNNTRPKRRLAGELEITAGQAVDWRNDMAPH
jgi:hypothetical protein